MFDLKIKLFCLFIFMTACQFNNGLTEGFNQRISSRNLSSINPALKTCVFDPGYSIVHFPMYHKPPSTENVSPTEYELVVQSQFQLLHSLLDYNRSLRGGLAVFDEHITSDNYNQAYLNRLSAGLAVNDTYRQLDGTVFFVSERQTTARNLFSSGWPIYYEYLSPNQKQFLWEVGAALTLYLLKELPQLYKVISPEKMNVVKAGIGNNFSQTNISQNYNWVFTFRETELKNEVSQFYQKNPSYAGLVFIAYGSSHDFSDEFLGRSFQSGHSFCMDWVQPSNTLP